MNYGKPYYDVSIECTKLDKKQDILCRKYKNLSCFRVFAVYYHVSAICNRPDHSV